MAIIVIKRRREPIEMANDRAQKIKDRWLGLNNQPKAEPNDLVDLDVWAGEYSQIASIEITRPAPTPVSTAVDYEAEAKKEREAFFKKTIEERGQSTARFELSYSVRTGNFSKAPDEIIEKAKKIQVEWYRANPDKHWQDFPMEAYGDLMPAKKGVSLSEKMTIKNEPIAGKTPENQRPREQKKSTEDIF
jgi:hypothetical protein